MSTEVPEATVAEELQQTVKSPKKTQGRKTTPKALVLPHALTVKRLAELTRISPIDTIKQLMRNGIMVTLNQVIDFEVATLVTSAFGIRVKQEGETTRDTGSPIRTEQKTDPSRLVVRPPVVTILGHVDHGKTTLLDYIRKSRIVEGEVGGITQHIGAYQVKSKEKMITFLDTPGHEAFTAIRARGARVTDIAVLVIAADDGVMPQTIEALNHAKAASVPLVVAINKIDRPDADPDKVKRQLGEQGLVLEEWGGDVITVPVSASTGAGIDELLESLQVVAEVSELKADPSNRATGVVIESKLDRTRGPLATVLVQDGTLRVGDNVLAGTVWGRVKAMLNDRGDRIDEADPSLPLEMMGFNTMPEAGDTIVVLPSEKDARSKAEERLRDRETERSSGRALTLEDIHTRINAGEVKELNLILKADVQGSVEAVRAALESLDDGVAKVSVLHAGSGAITESDVLLASASKAIVIGFSTSTQQGVERLAEREAVDIRHYDIIYRLVEDVDKALKGMLEAVFTDVSQGHAEVRAVFSVGKRNKIAGCIVKDGRISRNALVRLLRNDEVIHQGTISSLRHFKEEVNEMASGFECGVGITGYTEFVEGDVLETYRRERGSR